jgi:hypothetical protein
MIFILGSFFVGVSLIKIFFSKNNKEEKSIEDLMNEYEIIENTVCEKSLNKNNDDNNICIKEEMNIPIITIEHLNKIEENLENKIKNLGIKKNNNENKTDNENETNNKNENITAEERIFHTIMKKGNLYNDEYKRTIDNYVVIEFFKLAKELNINLEESINDDNFDRIYIRYVDELVRKKLD